MVAGVNGLPFTGHSSFKIDTKTYSLTEQNDELTMGLSDWALGTRSNISKEGFVQGIQSGIYDARVGIIRRIANINYEPEYILNEEWDILIVLDACRFDLMCEIASNYEYIGDIESHTSAATSTTAWSSRNFRSNFEDELRETAYVTANPNSITIGSIDISSKCRCGEDVTHDGRKLNITCSKCGQKVTGERIHPFKHFDEMWRESWNESLGTLLPDTVTARAIQTKRELNPEKLIVHYNQPHHPFIRNKGDSFETIFDVPDKSNIWQELRKGNVSYEAVWDAYRENLQHVLDSVSELLVNVDADPVIITSDHGNAMGELGIYGHPNPPVPIETLVKVPWIETKAQNREERNPKQVSSNQNGVEDDVDKRLRDLGYI